MRFRHGRTLLDRNSDNAMIVRRRRSGAGEVIGLRCTGPRTNNDGCSGPNPPGGFNNYFVEKKCTLTPNTCTCTCVVLFWLHDVLSGTISVPPPSWCARYARRNVINFEKAHAQYHVDEKTKRFIHCTGRLFLSINTGFYAKT